MKPYLQYSKPIYNDLKFTIKTKENSFYVIFLKLCKEVACFDSADRPIP